MTAPNETTPARDRVLNALPDFDADEATALWATARAVADATEIGYSTVTENLRKMEGEGVVEKSKDGRNTVWRLTEKATIARHFEDDANDLDAALDESADNTSHVEGPATVDLAPATAEFSGHVDSNVADFPTTDPEVNAAIGDDEGDPAEVVYAANSDLRDPLPEQDDEYDVRDVASIPPAPAQTAVDGPESADGTDTTPPAVPTSGAGVGAVLGFMQAVRPVSAPPADEAPAAKTGTCTKCQGAITKAGRSWKHDDAAKDADHKATTAVQREKRERAPRAEGDAPARVAPVRDGLSRAWERGELKARITDILQRRPDQDWSASTVTKHLNDKREAGDPIAQGGSVDFTLKTLHKEGVAKLTQDKPRRYAAA